VNFAALPDNRNLVEHSNRPRAEAWLCYAEDLNLGPFNLHRHRATQGAPEAPSASVPESASTIVNAARNVRASAVAASGGGSGSTPTLQDATASPPPNPAGAGIIPSSSDEALFSERIENDSFARIWHDITPNCTRCKLHKGRTQIVFGVGNPKAELVFVGEGPGRDEDAQGEPFVGRAGKLLTQMIEAMGLRRQDVYIANVVKCRPPENRLPEKDEIATCSPFLLRQIGCIQPKVVCALGSCSGQTLLQTTQGISRFRGEWFDFQGAKLIATYHPAYLLRNPAAKGEVWKDLQKVMAVLGLDLKRR
jgi:uracil-DNA glycosylase family 4